MELNSATKRTSVTVSVADRGDVDIRVVRNDRTVHTFSLPREEGIGANDVITVDKAGVVTITDMGGLEPRIKKTFAV